MNATHYKDNEDPTCLIKLLAIDEKKCLGHHANTVLNQPLLPDK